MIRKIIKTNYYVEYPPPVSRRVDVRQAAGRKIIFESIHNLEDKGGIKNKKNYVE
jgi:hypothetical protein